MSKRRPSPDTVIVDLTASDDEEIRTDQEARLGDVRRNLTANNASNKKLKKEGQRAAVKKEGERSFVHYPDVEVLEEASKPLVVPTPTATLEEDKKDDDVVMVGTVNETRLPHMRQHCTKFRLETSRFHPDYDKNEKHCDLCYCYVCDCPAKDCMVCTQARSFVENLDFHTISHDAI